MREERLGGGACRARRRERRAERRGERGLAARGVDEKARADREAASGLRPVEPPEALAPADDRGASAIAVEIPDARRLRFLEEEMIELRPVPVRVRDLVAGARADEMPVAAVAEVRERASRLVREEREAPLQARADPGVRRLPQAPLRERQEARQAVADREALEKQVREGGGGLADREARVRALLEKDDREADASRDEREERAGESGAHDRDVEGARHG